MDEKIQVIRCPSCGAPFDWWGNKCEHCGSAVRYIADGDTALPIQLSNDEIRKNVVQMESEFWESTSRAVAAPYSPYSKNLASFTPAQWKADCAKSSGLTTALSLIFDKMLVLPNEGMIGFAKAEAGNPATLLTSYRVFLLTGNVITTIPLERIVYYDRITREGTKFQTHLTIKYKRKDTIEKVDFKVGGSWIKVALIRALCDAGEWVRLNPLQQNLLTLSRYALLLSNNLKTPPLEPVPDPVKALKGWFR
jgi:hypothetical protein